MNDERMSSVFETRKTRHGDVTIIYFLAISLSPHTPNSLSATLPTLFLLLQVCPGAFDAAVPVVFDVVFRDILRAYHDQRSALPLPSLKILLQVRFRQVQCHISSSTFDSQTNKLPIVLDDVQTLSDQGMRCFVSRADHRDLRSILSPLLSMGSGIFQ
jgi:hypothetical protein